MMVTAVREITKAMFPVFRFMSDGRQMQLGVAGTGYFINDNGMFVTAAHIFDETTPQTQFVYLGLLPEHLHNPMMGVREIARDNKHDIYVGSLDLKNTGFLKFASTSGEIGQTVCIAGYPLPIITINKQGGFEVAGVRRYFQPSFILDNTTAQADNGKGVIRTHEGFLIRDFGLYGMSGGPVTDVRGNVVGMQASVTDPRESTNGTRTITVQNALAISGNKIREFLSANRIHFTVAASEESINT
jgi:S1-C subfamily serine protease